MTNCGRVSRATPSASGAVRCCNRSADRADKVFPPTYGVLDKRRDQYAIEERRVPSADGQCRRQLPVRWCSTRWPRRPTDSNWRCLMPSGEGELVRAGDLRRLPASPRPARGSTGSVTTRRRTASSTRCCATATTVSTFSATARWAERSRKPSPEMPRAVPPQPAYACIWRMGLHWAARRARRQVRAGHYIRNCRSGHRNWREDRLPDRPSRH